MYIVSPMENYNKSNPLVHLAKRKYDQITDDIHKHTKSLVELSICMVLYFLILSVVYFVFDHIVDTWIVWYNLTFIILFIAVYLYRISYYSNDHQGIKTFSELSKKEMSEILIMNNEDIMNCVNLLYELHSAMQVEFTMYKLFSLIIPITTLIDFFAILL